jgi:small-conductance mechanosensitive channel
LKLAAVAIIAACAFTWWLQAPVRNVASTLTWRVIGVIVAIVLGALGAAQTRAWVAVPVAVTTGLVLGAAWAEYRLPSDLHLSFLQSLGPAVSNYGWSLLAPGALAATVGVVLVYVIRPQRPRV